MQVKNAELRLRMNDDCNFKQDYARGKNET